MKKGISSSSRVITCCYLLNSSIVSLLLAIFVFKGLRKDISQLSIRMESSIPVSTASKMLFPSHTLDFKRSCSMISHKLSLHCSATSFLRVLCCDDLQKQVRKTKTKPTKQYLGSHWTMITAYHSNQNCLNMSLPFLFLCLLLSLLKTHQVKDFLLVPAHIASTTNRTLIYHRVSYMLSQCK